MPPAIRRTSRTDKEFDVLTACSWTASFNSAFSLASGSACFDGGDDCWRGDAADDVMSSAAEGAAAGRRYRDEEDICVIVLSCVMWCCGGGVVVRIRE